jgi:hypothetical protein
MFRFIFLDLVMSHSAHGMQTNHPNFYFNTDKRPADYSVIFDGSKVISVFDFVVECYALSEFKTPNE